MRRSLISRESIVLCFADSLPKDYKGSGMLTLYLRTEIDCIGVQRLLKSTNKFMRRIFSFKLLWHFHLAHQMSSHQIIKPSNHQIIKSSSPPSLSSSSTRTIFDASTMVKPRDRPARPAPPAQPAPPGHPTSVWSSKRLASGAAP